MVPLLLFVSVSLLAQAPASNELEQARQILDQARVAGAETLAASLYDDALSRINFAQANWGAGNDRLREQARMRAREATFAASAALAKARWLSTNAAIRTLQTDIRGFGGATDLSLPEEAPSVDFRRGTATKYRIGVAQAAIDQAKQAGALSQAASDLATAQSYVESALKVSRNGVSNSDVADHLAYTAEMMARRAYYDTRFRDANNYLPDVRLQRTRLAQAASERQAALEREQREQSERAAAELQQRLAQEQQNRAAQQEELDRLRAQIDEQRRAQQAQIEADRQAQLAAEQRLDDLNRQYVTAIAAGSPADIDALRRQIEDQQFTLRAVRAREDVAQNAMEQEINRSRIDLDNARAAGSMRAEVLSQREADLQARRAAYETFRNERQANLSQRAAIEQQEANAITEAQRRRQEQELAAAELRRQTEAAQRAAQEAQAQAQAAQEQAQAAQQEAQAAHQQAQSSEQQMQEAQKQAEAARQQAEAARQQTEAAKQQTEAAKQQTQQASQQAASAQEELERTKRELASREAETRRLRLQQSLSKYASTRTDPQRGIIVTLPSIMFDTGKSTLKKGAKSTLKNIAQQLEAEPTLVITVEGHTDDTGSAAKNLKLSEQRAQEVRDYLIAAGIHTDHLTAVGRGEADPVAPNKTAAGRQQNRRVELIIAP